VVEREAYALAYQVAGNFERVLKAVENSLVTAVMSTASSEVRLAAVMWLVRRSILMGLAEAEAELDPNWGVIHWQG